MEKDIQEFEGEQYIRVNKTVAKKEYEKGNSVLILPSKVRFQNKWIIPFNMKKFGGRGFNHVVSEYEYYNCNYELGYHCRYYIKKGV